MSLSKKRKSQEPADDGRTPGCSNCPVQIHLKLLDKGMNASQGIPVSVATTKDDLYMHCSRRGEFIDVYDRNNLREVNHVVDMEARGAFPLAIGACSLSNCLYVLIMGRKNVNSIVRMTKNHGDQFDISPLITGLSEKIKCLFVSPNGSLIVSKRERPNDLISIYNSDGSLQHQIKLSESLGLFHVSRIIPKSSGNFVLVSYNYEFKRKLTEIDMDGKVVHQYQSSLLGCDVASADGSGRILIVDRNNGMELLDSELHLLDVTLPEEPDDIWAHPRYLHYDRLRNEVLMIDYTGWFGQGGTISVFNFTEEK